MNLTFCPAWYNQANKKKSYKFTKKDWSIEEMLDLLAVVLK